MDIAGRHLAVIQDIIAEVLKDIPCTVYLFGSRATGQAQRTSDVDIAVLSEHDVSARLSLFRERLEQSNLPYAVDVVDLHVAAAPFVARVQQEGKVLWKS
ncbi:MAG TPA: nucleotidyltransferase domain-containing protein [Anaerolineae bacterium]|nr:nucleotidyltransferase domain-containing protein [Anaerolineae bacterium]